MLSHAALLDEIRRLRDEGGTSNAELARLLDLPTSRIADIFATDRKPRKITLDEAKTLVEHFKLDKRPQAGLPNSAVLTATFVVMLDHLGLDPNEGALAQKLAERLPATLRRMQVAAEDRELDDETIPGEAAPALAEGRRSP
jgi:hypothetical protein